ncbi:MAG TPA: sigma 54-interacting transcriptional regulator [Terriglobales bacterium]|jgi:transcriptional regulator with PAS, ATPase and Fis domain|nr:sigma 54-interacting transcriptional regulator [Terriglobales bacterium]
MAKPLALMIHSLDSPLGGVSKLLEARDCSVHVSRSLDEAERVVAAFPTDQLKFIFADLTICQGEPWHNFTERLRKDIEHIALVCYDPKHPQPLYGLLGQANHVTADPNSPHAIKMPVMIGDTPQFHEIINLANRYAMHDITVLITGETGTGKEVMAQYIHANGPRADKPFVGCNMTAIPETLVESELFGYVRGAFTGADRNKKGFIEAAEGGTLFLDEIGDLAPSIQLKLLRFLETRQYYRVGESTPKTSDVRIIAATNKELEEAIQGTGFRKDLYFRLNSARIILPPLRDRREDIILLIANFVFQACSQFQRSLKKLSSSAKALFLDYPWPGNIRELKSVIESAVMVADSEYITISDLPMNLQQYATGRREEIGTRAIRNIEEGERMVIEDALRQTNGNKAKAAEALGISTRTLYRKLEKFALAD